MGESEAILLNVSISGVFTPGSITIICGTESDIVVVIYERDTDP